MSSAAEQVFENHVIYRNLLKYLAKSTLVSVLVIEQRGDRFNWCVRELYATVDHDVVGNMARDSERRERYLDAILVIEAKASRSFCGLTWNHHRANSDLRGDQVYTPLEVQALREKCPNLRVITTRNNPLDPWHQYTMILAPVGSTGIPHLLHLHHKTEFHQWLLESYTCWKPFDASPWQNEGWVVQQTARLQMFRGSDRDPEPTLARLLDTDLLDCEITEFDLGDLVVPLHHLTSIVDARVVEGKKRVTRVTAAVKPFDFIDLAMFLRAAGPDLVSLDLYILNCQSSILTVADLHRIIRIIRGNCPRLTTLRLPVTVLRNGGFLVDEEIFRPTPKFSLGGGSLEHFGLYLYGTVIDSSGSRSSTVPFIRLFSVNTAFNFACFLAPGGSLELYNGERVIAGSGPSPGPVRFEEIERSITTYCLRFSIIRLSRLDPVLEGHLRSKSLQKLGVQSLADLLELQFDADGKPVPVAESWELREEEQARSGQRRKTRFEDMFVDMLCQRFSTYQLCG